MGAEAAARAAVAIVAERPRALLAVGFCGALDPALRVGDLVAAERVLDEATGETFAPDAALLAAAPGRRGVLVSARRIARTPDARARLSGTAVDLESAALARAAGAAGIPFLAVRAVTDTTRHRLPDFEAIAAGAPDIPIGRLLAHVLRRPWELPRLVRLGPAAGRAGSALAGGVGDMLAAAA